MKLFNKDTQGMMEINTKNITEQQLMESCLMYYHSGYNYRMIFFLYALSNRWHKDKLLYYVKLIEDLK